MELVKQISNPQEREISITVLKSQNREPIIYDSINQDKEVGGHFHTLMQVSEFYLYSTFFL